MSEVFLDPADKILQWLSPTDSSKNYNEACKKHQEETCSWFITGTQFTEWKTQTGIFLWVYGIRKFYHRLQTPATY
jgi:hypothetical protein